MGDSLPLERDAGAGRAAASWREESARKSATHDLGRPAGGRFPAAGGLPGESQRPDRDPRTPTLRPDRRRLSARVDGHRRPHRSAQEDRGRDDHAARAGHGGAVAAGGRDHQRQALHVPGRRAAGGASDARGDDPTVAAGERTRPGGARRGGDQAGAGGSLAHSHRPGGGPRRAAGPGRDRGEPGRGVVGVAGGASPAGAGRDGRAGGASFVVRGGEPAADRAVVPRLRGRAGALAPVRGRPGGGGPGRGATPSAARSRGGTGAGDASTGRRDVRTERGGRGARHDPGRGGRVCAAGPVYPRRDRCARAPGRASRAGRAGGILRPSTAGADSQVHAGPPATRNRAGLGARLHALPAALAAPHSRHAAARQRRTARGDPATGRFRGARVVLGTRPAAGPRRGVPPVVAGRAVPGGRGDLGAADAEAALGEKARRQGERRLDVAGDADHDRAARSLPGAAGGGARRTRVELYATRPGAGIGRARKQRADDRILKTDPGTPARAGGAVLRRDRGRHASAGFGRGGRPAGPGRAGAGLRRWLRGFAAPRRRPVAQPAPSTERLVRRRRRVRGGRAGGPLGSGRRASAQRRFA